jgi:hypothetical protein
MFLRYKCWFKEEHCIVRTRTSLYYNSFIPSSVRLWNLQPDNIRLSPSIQALKYSLKSNISSKPFYYYTGLRITNFWTAKNNSTFWLGASLDDPKRSIYVVRFMGTLIELIIYLQNHFIIILVVALGKFSIPDYECSVPL